MIQKKICMVGAFAVGKTSLVSRFVHSMFDEKYLTTVGVKIDKKTLAVNDVPVTLVIWDLAGEDEILPVRLSHLRGAAGYILVADGTRPETLEVARGLDDRVRAVTGDVPRVLALNKHDLKDQWSLEPSTAAQAFAPAPAVFLTSAKSGEGVEDLFATLARAVADGGEKS